MPTKAGRTKRRVKRNDGSPLTKQSVRDRAAKRHAARKRNK